MSDAKNSLLPFFPEDLTEDQAVRLTWATMMVDFWSAIRPHGYVVKVYIDEEIRAFLVKYRNIAGYLGLGRALLDLIVTPPPSALEAEQAPVEYPPQVVIQRPSPMAQEPFAFSS
jgi:hypothetical protein